MNINAIDQAIEAQAEQWRAMTKDQLKQEYGKLISTSPAGLNKAQMIGLMRFQKRRLLTKGH